MDVNTLLKMLMKKKATKTKKTKTKKTNKKQKTKTKKNKPKTTKKKKNSTSLRRKNCCPKGYILQDNGSGVLTCVKNLITTIADNLLKNPLYLKKFYDEYGIGNDYYNDSLYRPSRYHHVSLNDSVGLRSCGSSSSSRRISDW